MRRKFYGLILPGFILSFLAGVVVGFVIFFFKLAIDYILKLNNLIYHFLNNYIYFIPVTIIILLMHLWRGLGTCAGRILSDFRQRAYGLRR